MKFAIGCYWVCLKGIGPWIFYFYKTVWEHRHRELLEPELWHLDWKLNDCRGKEFSLWSLSCPVHFCVLTLLRHWCTCAKHLAAYYPLLSFCNSWFLKITSEKYYLLKHLTSLLSWLKLLYLRNLLVILQENTNFYLT